LHPLQILRQLAHGQGGAAALSGDVNGGHRVILAERSGQPRWRQPALWRQLQAQRGACGCHAACSCAVRGHVQWLAQACGGQGLGRHVGGVGGGGEALRVCSVLHERAEPRHIQPSPACVPPILLLPSQHRIQHRVLVAVVQSRPRAQLAALDAAGPSTAAAAADGRVQLLLGGRRAGCFRCDLVSTPTLHMGTLLKPRVRPQRRQNMPLRHAQMIAGQYDIMLL
jgi:hypothetical protein